MEFDMMSFIAMENSNKIRRYRDLNRLAKKGETVFAGSSLMENFPILELLMNRGISKVIYNRGMSGYVTEQLEHDIGACILELQPSRLFINIGTNDLDLGGDTIGNMIRNYRRILQRVQAELPACEITVMAYYPIVKPVGAMEPPPGKDRNRTLQDIVDASAAAEKMAGELGCRFVDLNAKLKDDDGYLRPELAADPIHMLPRAYDLVLDELLKYL